MAKYRIAVDKFTPRLDFQNPITVDMKYPLLFEPGTSWDYGVGLDRAGKMVERVSGIDLEGYLNKHVWGALGPDSITFYPKRHSTTFQRLVDMSLRTGGVSALGAAINSEAPVEYTENNVWNLEPPDCFGGAGLYGNLVDYQKLLNSICADDEKILKKETVDLMFQDHLSAASKTALYKVSRIPQVREVFGGLAPDMEITYGLSGMLYLKDLEGGRRAGTMTWGGYPNLTWFIDRQAGLSGIAGTQIIPPGDAKYNRLFLLWEQELYERAGNGKLPGVSRIK